MESINNVANNNTQISTENDEGMTIIGKRKKNPFTVANMKTAYANIGGKDKNGGSGLNIRTTHLYVKFLPQDSTEVEALEQLEITDSLSLFDYPLDVDIISSGTFYHDPNVPTNVPTPKYTSVKLAYTLPQNISYQILDSLYLPETDLDTNKSNSNAILEALEYEAFRLTDNLDDISKDKGAKFYPSGYIRTETTKHATSLTTTTEGVPWVKVTARRWFTIESDETDINGYYFINHKFDDDVNYQMKFHNDWVMINQANVGTLVAYKDGPKKTGSWDYTSWRGLQSYLWKGIMRGVYDWHNVYDSYFNLPSPPDVKIRGITGSWNGQCNMIRSSLSTTPANLLTFFFNDIRVGNPTEYYYRIYEVTIHEMAHATHWYSLASTNANRNARMIRSKQLVREGWASGFTDHAIKKKFGHWYYAGCRTDIDHTSKAAMAAAKYPRMIAQDLWDNNNQFDATKPYCDVVDNVSGIPLSDVFNALQDVGHSGGIDSENYRMTQWRNRLKVLHPTQAVEINNYFSQYWLN